MTQEDFPSTPSIRGIAEQMRRIESKLDALLEALDTEDEKAANVITTMDGERLELPSGDDFLSLSEICGLPPMTRWP